MIVIDTGNEFVALAVLFLACLGLAFMLVGFVALVAQARAVERERRKERQRTTVLLEALR
jgi:hypothetical protein